MEAYQRILDDHMEESKERWQKLEDMVENLRDNHVSHLAADVSELKADVKWIKLIGGFIIVESLAMLGGIISILIKLYVK